MLLDRCAIFTRLYCVHLPFKDRIQQANDDKRWNFERKTQQALRQDRKHGLCRRGLVG